MVSCMSLAFEVRGGLQVALVRGKRIWGLLIECLVELEHLGAHSTILSAKTTHKQTLQMAAPGQS